MTEEMKRFMKTDFKKLTYAVIRKAAKQFWKDYKDGKKYIYIEDKDYMIPYSIEEID